MKVAIQGYTGSFHEIAAREYFGGVLEALPCATFRDVARKVECCEANYGIMAIENSIAGSIISNYSILQNHNLQVDGEVYLHIRQHLMALQGTRLEDIHEVRSHPIALLQCVDFLDEHLGWRLVESEDTAGSAKEVAEQKLKGVAAIAGSLAAELHGLEIVVPDIHTIKQNATRFLVLKRADNIWRPGANKASLYFKIDHEKGSLLRVLQQTADGGINLSKLQSYPIPSDPWNYLFHVDMEFDHYDDCVLTLNRMRRVASEVYVYGIYPRGNRAMESANKHQSNDK